VLELRPNCEHCDTDLPAAALTARICTFECTFCSDCATAVFGNVCPNCGGELLARPVRPAALVDASSGERVTNEHDLDAHRTRRDERPIDGDHPGVVLRRYVEAWTGGDIDRLLGCYGDDFTLHYAGSSRFAGAHGGRDVAVAVMVEVSALAPRRLISIDDVLASDGGGVVVVTEELQRGDERCELQRVFRYRIAEGLLRECWLYEADQAVVDRFWR